MSEAIVSMYRSPGGEGYEAQKERIQASKHNEMYKLEKFSTHNFGPRLFMRGVGKRGWDTIEFMALDDNENIIWVKEALDGEITDELVKS